MSRTAARSLSSGILFLAAAVACVATWALAKTPVPETVTPAASESAARKLDRIREAHETGGSFGTVQISEHEANSYLAYDLAYAIPAGVSGVSLQFQPGRVSGTTLVDFDRLKEGAADAAPSHRRLLPARRAHGWGGRLGLGHGRDGRVPARARAARRRGAAPDGDRLHDRAVRPAQLSERRHQSCLPVAILD